MSNIPVNRYTVWQAVSAALGVGMRALEEVRSLSRQPGPQGPPGDNGSEGPPGKLPIVKEWKEGSVYYNGNVVTHEGCTYQALRDTAQHVTHNDWICICRSGRDGSDGKSFVIRGTFSDAATDYAELDVVVLNGAAFVARRNDPGACPGDGWQMISTQGKRGQQGERGSIGPKGDPGAPVIAMHVDGNGLLTLLNADGSSVTCDLYPLLAKLK